MTDSAFLKFAVVGAGVIGRRHIDAITKADHVELAAIVDVDPAATALADEHKVPCFDSVSTMCASCDVDGVIVATPTIHHVAPAIQAMEAGCHAFVEKPITATLEEAHQLIDCAARTGKHVLVGHQRRYYSLVEKTRQMIAAGELGTLIGVSGQWAIRKNDDYYDPQWRKERAAGPVLTNLIHEIDYLRYICGDIASVSAEISNDAKGFEKEDAAAIVLRFQSGALGTFFLTDQASSPWSWELGTGENWSFPPTHQNCIRFMGTRASLDFPNLTLWHQQDRPNNWTELIEPKTIEQPFEDPYVLQCEHFARVIRGDETPRIDAVDGAKTLAATLAVFDAAEQGARINLD